MSPDSLNLPRPFGRYTLLRRLAVGGMAEVYIARAKGIGGFEKLVAVKVIHPRFSEDEHFVQMLVEEAKISVMLTHNNIAQCFDLGCIEETYYIVMEFIDGADVYKTLKKAEAKSLRLPFDVCAFVASEVCRALDYAHRKRDSEGRPLSIVHRDVSPQNVLLSFEGEVKLVDFGIAKAASRMNQTEAGVIKGKYYYMSPEQAWGDPMDHRSDIFSVGIVLAEMLTGDMVYRGDNIPHLIDKVRKAEIVSPITKRPEIPEPLEAIIMRALQKNPEARYGSAREMATELTDFLYAASPSFRPQQVATLMGELFEGVRRPAADLPELDADAQRPAVLSMERHEFAPDVNKSVILAFEDNVEEDPTRHDLSAYRVHDKGNSDAAPISASSALPSSRPEPSAHNMPGTVRLGDPEDEDVATRVLSQKNQGAWDDPTEVSNARPFPQHEESAVERAKASVPPPPPVSPFDPPKRRASVGASRGSASASPNALPAPFPSPNVPFNAAAPNASAPNASTATDPFIPAAHSTAGHDAQLFAKRALPRWFLPAALGAVVLIGVITAVVLLVSSPSAPVPELTVRSEPGGARVELDGVPQPGRTPLTIRDGLRSGQNHQLRVLHPGFETWTATFKPASGRAVQVAVLSRAQSSLRVDSSPTGALIWVDGVLHGAAPVLVEELSPNRSYEVRAVSEASGTAQETVQMPDVRLHEVVLTLTD